MSDPADEPTHVRPSDPDDATYVRGDGADDPTADDATYVRGNQPGTPTPDEDPLVGNLLLNRYLIVKKIGGGGFGSVYHASDELKREGGERHEIAIKTLDLDVSSDRLVGLIQEVSRSHTVSHPNIMRVYDIHRDGELAFITMELLVGEELEDRMKSAGQLEEAEVDRVAEAMCSALEHCHDERLVHSDIKPANIFMCSDGDIKLLDLGIAQMIGSANQLAGYSPLYASPEQMQGGSPDARDDLFSLSVVLYQALTGSHPFNRKNSLEAQAADHEPDTSILPRRYRAALDSGLSYTRDERPLSAQKLWSRINPAVRKRYVIAAVLAAVAAAMFVVSNQVGEQVGKAAISVSDEDQAYAQARYDEAVAWVSNKEGDAREALVDALQHNPYLEEAAELMVAQVRAATPADPSQFSLAWSDYTAAYAASPTSESLNEFAAEAAEAILARDINTMSRLEVLSQLRVPVCALSGTGYRTAELTQVSEAASISC
ncbi:MAG: serine/threonine protein kinase [Gammaproteobacteria bacterium]|nr:serine/threonine protein kinase [Gammaproteobacteria bacterium]